MRIKDVAREAGVSTATVSHVINKTKYVSDETRQKVLSALERVNYYPNAHARTLASGRSIREVVVERGHLESGKLTEEQLDAALDVLRMTRP